MNARISSVRIVSGEDNAMAKYGKKASRTVERTMRKRKRGTLRSGRSGKKVTSRKQAIAIGLSETRRSGAKVPRKRSSRRKSTSKRTSSSRKR
jgi:hypothetical protein